MKVVITRTTPIYARSSRSGVFLQWHLEDPPDSAAIVFRVRKGGGPEGPFETVAEGITSFYLHDYHDVQEPGTVTQNHHTLQRTLFYEVTATAVAQPPAPASRIAPARAVAPVGDFLPRRQYLLRRKIHSDIRDSFRFNSIPFAVLKRRHWGVRCTACFDLTTGRVTNGRCPVCYSTGFVGGYHEPVEIAARKGVTNVHVQDAAQGKVEVNQIDITLLDYPALQVDDLVCEIRQDRRYIVKHATRTELRGVPVHQKAVLSELSRDSVAYDVLLKPGMSPALY